MKKLLSVLLAGAMAFSYVLPASALTNYKFEDYKANYNESHGELPTIDEKNPNVTIVKGKEGTGDYAGMMVGPYLHSGAKFTKGEDIKEVVYIDHSTLKIPDVFQLSYQIFSKGKYAMEVDTYTQLGYDGKIHVSLTAGGSDFLVELPDNGIYGYEFTGHVDNKGVITVGFAVYNEDGTLVKAVGGIPLNNFRWGSAQEVSATDDVTLEAIFFCNIKVADGIRVYNMPDADTVAVADSDAVEDAETVAGVLADALANSDYRFDDVTVGVEVSDEEVDKDAVEEIKTGAKDLLEGITLSNFFDVTVAVRDTNKEEVGSLTELSEAIALTVAIPEDITPVAEGYSRKYYVVRDHEGKVELLDAVVSEDGKTLTFESNLFSTYAIAYADTQDPTVSPENPNTGDKIVSYVIAAGISGVALAGIALFSAKKKQD